MPTQPAVSLRTLLQGSLDYAGMFPPAKLPLDAAWAKYHEAWTSPYRWLLRSFVCPVGQLDTLAKRWAASPAPLGRFTAIGMPDADAAALAADVAQLAAFYDRVAAEAGPPIELSYEVRPPADATADPAAWAAYCTELNAALHRAGVPLNDVFLEVPLDLPRLASLAWPVTDGCWTWGLKFRTGGLTADAFPPADDLASVLAWLAARQETPAAQNGNQSRNVASVRYKATAGLHHPLPRDVAEPACTMHGFINLFVAAVLASSTASSAGQRLGAERSASESASVGSLALAILQERDPQAFHFENRQLRWRDRHASLAAIASLRRHHFVGFGSCSFDEPVKDLQSLGWI